MTWGSCVLEGIRRGREGMGAYVLVELEGDLGVFYPQHGVVELAWDPLRLMVFSV